jgi:hypothetical protein
MTEAEGALQAFLGSKSVADLVCEFEHKAPPVFLAEAGQWFQRRKDGRSTRKTDTPTSPT